MSDIQHTVKAVSKRTGLSAHVIRVWEKRYGAVIPQRTDTNRRLYSEQEVQRLELLQRATQAGHAIGQVAKLSTEKLRELVGSLAPVALGQRAKDSPADELDSALVTECVSRVKELDGAALNRAFEQGMLRLGHMGFLNRIAAPLSQQVGEMWRTGELTAAHEHFLTASVRSFLGQSARQFPLSESAPVMVVATPAGQVHELGAVMVMSAAANLGWRVTYLGASLPAAEIAGATIQNKARVVALSIVYPEDDPALPEEFAKLRRYLSAEVKILAGGRAAAAYSESLNQISALRIEDLDGLAAALDRLRKR